MSVLPEAWNERARFERYDRRTGEWLPKSCPTALARLIEDGRHRKAWDEWRGTHAHDEMDICSPESIVMLLPTYKRELFGFLPKTSATAKAGETWPPDPPPVKSIFIMYSISVETSLN